MVLFFSVIVEEKCEKFKKKKNFFFPLGSFFTIFGR